jgi:hypothetical protein
MAILLLMETHEWKNSGLKFSERAGIPIWAATGKSRKKGTEKGDRTIYLSTQ